tara:strand:- start:223 stop:477 length:255 start_codon:yes stop_codon:yes gene_type:complete
MKDNDELLRAQIDDVIRGEIQEDINEYINENEKVEGFGKDEKLKINIPKDEITKILREYKKIKKRQRSNLNQVKLLDKYGKPLK